MSAKPTIKLQVEQFSSSNLMLTSNHHTQLESDEKDVAAFLAEKNVPEDVSTSLIDHQFSGLAFRV